MSIVVAKSSGRVVRAVLLAVFALLSVWSSGRAEDSGALTSPASSDEITALVEQLGHPDYQKRVHATRRLMAIGMPAQDPLRATAKGSDAEAAFRADAVLRALNRVMFSGVTIELSLSKTKIHWDAPVDLFVTLTNESLLPARVPFELPTTAERETPDDAGQVGVMLDVAEHLRVTDPLGRKLELTVDDIAADLRVEAAVESRNDGGPTAELAPGGSIIITAREFNRGWARYRMLEEGTYQIQFDYVPLWDDEVLAAYRVGGVVSNCVSLTVEGAAPESISRRGEEAALQLERQGRFLVATITNRTDRKVVINKNLGNGPPFAKAHWRYATGEQRGTIPSDTLALRGMEKFDAELLVPLGAGRSLELTRVDEARLVRALVERGERDDAGPWEVHFSYTNLLSRRWQLQGARHAPANPLAPAGTSVVIPRRILFASCSSNVVSLDREE